MGTDAVISADFIWLQADTCGEHCVIVFFKKIAVDKVHSCRRTVIRQTDVAKKRIVRMGSVTERGLTVEGPYGEYPEPDSEPCVISTA